MENNTIQHNSIFSFTFAGALLFVAAFAFTMAYFSKLVMFELSYMCIAAALISSSASLIYKAVKNDRHRLGHV
jgi:glucan phosphoethanolaminetransferase (alkaline phosphatase superfamily)